MNSLNPLLTSKTEAYPEDSAALNEYEMLLLFGSFDKFMNIAL